MGALFSRLTEVIAAWQAKDVDTVLTYMADDIVWHYAAPGQPPVRGKAAAGKLLRKFQADMHDIQWRIFHYAETADRLFIEGVDDYITTGGKRVAVPYTGVLEFRDGLITGWRDYVDLGVIAQQKAGEPFTAQVDALIGREAAR